MLATGDVCNKIGTYLKALAAKDNGVPFYVALPSSTFDWVKSDGVKEIPIELRDAREVKSIQGVLPSLQRHRVCCVLSMFARLVVLLVLVRQSKELLCCFSARVLACALILRCGERNTGLLEKKGSEGTGEGDVSAKDVTLSLIHI